MSHYENFTSLPPDKEREFIIYEKTSIESGKKAMRVGAIAGVAFGLLVIIIAMSFEKPKNKMADDDLGMLKRADKEEKAKDKAPAPDPAAAPAAAEGAPAEGAPAEGAPAEGAKPAEGAPAEGAAPAEGEGAKPAEGAAQ